MENENTILKNENVKQLSIEFDKVETNPNVVKCQIKIISFNEKIRENKDMIRNKIFDDILKNSTSF